MFNRSQRLVLSFLFLLTLTVGAALVIQAGRKQEVTLTVLPKAEQKKTSFQVTMKQSPWWAKIYYTLDGSLPQPGVATTFLYQEPVTIAPTTDLQTQAVVVRAQAKSFFSTSSVVTITYLVGEEVEKRFVTPVISLVSDPINLYSEEMGILVPGETRALYEERYPEATISGMSPANYNWRGRESERPANISIFRASDLLLQKEVGIKVHGYGTRSFDQKSFTLTARNEYDEEGKFNYYFFPKYLAQDGETTITGFNRLLLRTINSSGENDLIRNEVVNYLAQKAGLLGAVPATPMAVYINGEYYGVSFLSPDIDEKMLQTLYDTADDNFQLLKLVEKEGEFVGGEVETMEGTQIQLTTEEEQIRQQLNQLVQSDLTVAENWQKFEEAFDVSSLLSYYAFEVAMGNGDWPNNNMKLWRYTGETQVGTDLDGRWRFLAFDFDRALIVGENEMASPSYSNINGGENSLVTIENDGGSLVGRLFNPSLRLGYSPLLNAVLQRPAERMEWLNDVSDWRTTLLTEEIMSEAIRSTGDLVRQEVDMAAKQGERYPSWLDTNFINSRYQLMMEAAQIMNQHVKNELTDLFDLQGEVFTVEVVGIKGGQVKLNQLQTVGNSDEKLTSEYFVENQVPLTITTRPGFIFKYWLINGEKVFEPEVSLSAAMAKNGKISVQPIVTATKEKQDLRINEIVDDGQNDWLEIYNPNREETLFLSDYCLTDDERQLCLFMGAEVAVPPQSYMVLHGQKSQREEAWHQYIFNFNLKEGETVWLSRRDKAEVIQKVKLPLLTKQQSLAYDEKAWHFWITEVQTMAAENEFN